MAMSSGIFRVVFEARPVAGEFIDEVIGRALDPWLNQDACLLFSDGFESGDLSAWSGSAGGRSNLKSLPGGE